MTFLNKNIMEECYIFHNQDILSHKGINP